MSPQRLSTNPRALRNESSHRANGTGAAGNSRTEAGGFSQEDLTMLQLATVVLVIALLAALLGFGGLAGSFVGLARIVFFVFLVLAILSFFGGIVFRRRYSG